MIKFVETRDRRAYHREYYRQNRERLLSRQRDLYRSQRDGRAVLRRGPKARPLLRLYGLTREQFLDKLAAQSGRCAICDKPMGRVTIDHDHISGKARGLLCQRCNRALSSIEIPGFIEKARLYLDMHR